MKNITKENYWDRSKMLTCPRTDTWLVHAKMQIFQKRKINNNPNLHLLSSSHAPGTVLNALHKSSHITFTTDPRPLSFYRQGDRGTKGLSLCAEGHTVVNEGAKMENPGSMASKSTLSSITLNNLPSCFCNIHSSSNSLCHMLWRNSHRFMTSWLGHLGLKTGSFRHRLGLQRASHHEEMLSPMQKC